MSDAPEAWRTANRRYLLASVGLVKERLERLALPPNAKPPNAGSEYAEAERALPAPSALAFLAERFGLTSFERWMLVLCAGPELESDFGVRCAAASGEPRRPYPTFTLARAALPEPHWDALTPDRPLRRFRLIELLGEDAVGFARLKLDERILHFLNGFQTEDERLRGVIERFDTGSASELAPTQRELAQRIALTFQRAERPLPIVHLCGSEQAAKELVVAAACRERGCSLHVLRAADVPLNANDRDGLARLWQREAVLTHSALLIVCDEVDQADHVRAAVALAERLDGMVVMASRDPLRFPRVLTLRLDLERPTAAEQESLWRGVLGPLAATANGQIGGIVAQFSLGVASMRAAGAEVKQRVADGGGELGEILWEACRSQARPRMDDLAQRILPGASWDDIVLPGEQIQLLRDVAAHVRQRATVYEKWGFGKRGARGLGITALFAGSSGTGKTMAAEVIAADLKLDLCRVDLSQVVSKYIGETEKNLRRVFDAAEEGGAVLLFDEADALFGKRSEVKDSHDRYANLEVSYLLQRMEAYRGLAILTTNMRNALDTAFVRRLRFIVEFPFPGGAERAEIWRRVFPARTPTEGLDVQRLSRLNLPGGVIRNIALNAAFLAADRNEPVRMTHLRHAAEIEFLKLERPLTDAELGPGGWT